MSAGNPNTPDPILIAVVDDDEDVRASLQSLLDSLGYASELFDSADSFLVSPLAERVKCIISDMQMPGTNGVQLARAVQARGTPIILITAYPTGDVRKQAAAAAARCILVKPFNASELVDQLARLFG